MRSLFYESVGAGFRGCGGVSCDVSLGPHNRHLSGRLIVLLYPFLPLPLVLFQLQPEDCDKSESQLDSRETVRLFAATSKSLRGLSISLRSAFVL
jgi:hypothetical protein